MFDGLNVDWISTRMKPIKPAIDKYSCRAHPYYPVLTANTVNMIYSS